MSVELLQAAKKELERKLLFLITEFEEDTGLFVESVGLEAIQDMGYSVPHTTCLKIDVRL